MGEEHIVVTLTPVYRQMFRNQPFLLVDPTTIRKTDSSTLSESISDTDLAKRCEQKCPCFWH